jgi:peptide/nickel transport system substrate-binding protein/oligopeptide transport system substrate-binding protein
MAEKPLSQRRRNVIVAAGLAAITLIASLASILPFVGITSIDQLGAALARAGTAYSQGLLWLEGYTGVIGFSLVIAVWVVFLVGVLLLAMRKTKRSWRVYEAALALPLMAALFTPLYIPAPVKPPLEKLPDAQQVWREGLQGTILDKTLDPAYVTQINTSLVDELIFPGLVKLDKDARVQNWAAKSAQAGQDGESYTFTLRAGMTWSDGAPITAQDFAYSINRTLDPCTKSPAASYLLPIKDAGVFHSQQCSEGKATGAIPTLISHSLLVRDPLTLTIQLEHPTPSFLAQLTYPSAWAVPRKLIDAYGADWAGHLADNGGVGGDLFKITTMDLSAKIVLQRNERFWGTKSILRELDFIVYPGTDPAVAKDAMYAAYIAGDREVTSLFNDVFASASLRPDYHASRLLSLQYFGVNWTTPPFDDVRMRQAFALALDKEKLAQDQTFCTACVATNHIVPSGMPGYSASLKGPDGTTGLKGDSTRASALARSYATDKCSGTLSRCPQVTLSYFKGLDTYMQEVKGMWSDALPGYPIALQPLSAGELFGQLGTPNLQIYWLPWGADYPDPQDFLSLDFLPAAANNFGTVDLPTATTLMRQADVELNPSKRMNAYNQAEQLLVTNVAWIPLDQGVGTYLLRPNVVNYQESAVGGPSIDTWQHVYLGKL